MMGLPVRYRACDAEAATRKQPGHATEVRTAAIGSAATLRDNVIRACPRICCSSAAVPVGLVIDDKGLSSPGEGGGPGEVGVLDRFGTVR